MSHDLSLAQKHAWRLARTLMIPVVLFQSDDAYGVLPAEEVEDAEVEILFEYDPYTGGHAVHGTSSPFTLRSGGAWRRRPSFLDRTRPVPVGGLGGAGRTGNGLRRPPLRSGPAGAGAPRSAGCGPRDGATIGAASRNGG